MKRTTSFLVDELIALSFSTSEACTPPETYTDQNGDKRHVKTDKVDRGDTSARDSKKNINEGENRHHKPETPGKFGGIVTFKSM